MNALEATLVALAQRLEAADVPYMIVGGLANLHWGRPRLTQDIDVTIQVEDEELVPVLARLAPEFEPLIEDPAAFARETSVVPLRAASGIRIDLIVARLEMEREAIRRSVPVVVGERPVRMATAEDLVLQKIVSDRSRDHEDAEGVVRRQRATLDRDFLLPRVADLARALDKPDLVAIVRAWLED